MAVICTWSDLAELRSHGQAPLLRLIVTTDPTFARRMTWVGCMAIVHNAGEVMPVELLHGLDVILDLGRCERAGAVKRLCDAREVKPTRLEAWCGCDRSLSTIAIPCSVDDVFDYKLDPQTVAEMSA